MIEFSGTNRSYCYVRYTTQEEAREAIKKLNNYHVRPGYPLAGYCYDYDACHA